MATAQEFLEKAASYIGIGGTDNIFNTWYWGYHCYNADMYPWCACFQSYVGVHDLNMPFEASASAAGVAWQGTRIADEDVQPGDWVVFTWDGRQDFSWCDHIAVVEWSDINGSGYFGTIDGNSGGGQGVVQRNTYYNYGNYGTAFFRPPYDNSGSTPEPEPEPAPKPEHSRLHMIDIASWQEGIDVSAVDCDIVAIKVTGGTSYENPFWRQWADAALNSGKLLAFYHYACEYDSEPGGKAEADFFWSKVKDYKGKFIPILDWEAHATGMPVSYAKAFLDRIKKLSGATPLFYGYASNVNSTDYSAISSYPLWMASYLNKYDGAGWVDNPDQTWDTGAWDSLFAYQYTSTGQIAGYGGNLDLSIVYCTPTQWRKMCGGASPSPAPTPTPGGQPYYNVKTHNGWCGKMKGLVDTTGSSDDFGGIYGEDMIYLAIGDAGEYQVHDINGNWWPRVNKYDTSDEEHGMAGAGAPIDCVRIFDSSVHYQTHNKGGGWNDVMVGTYDASGSGDDFAGQYGVPQDAIRIWRE